MPEKGILYELKLLHKKDGWGKYDEYDTRGNAVDIGKFKVTNERNLYSDYQVNKIKV